ncbi:hypothetical protein SASPL_138339 [Salvia splendens]|uniref:Reverse transcriptase domain-containing protein n=1 Tax=Salvia splendens TaxID=180675 RepID=A0A8X8WV86_SALSN|nr:hypothetical protein SASPL_138339 [Salvia splendens]
MTIKVDLEKAYDRIRWEFLEDCMMDLGLPQQLINLIMECVSTATMQVIWNGSPTSVFKPERGIRQGDPLSPYLFVLGMEKLSHSINKSVQDGDWDPIRLARHGSSISHLFFADDLVLFCKVDMKNTRTLKSILDKFSHHSGHKVSASKTQLFFSPNTDISLAQAIQNHLQFRSVCNLGKYLGIPIFHGMVTKNNFQYLIDKVRARLSGWSASSLSLAGRITLAKAVLTAIPSYCMQVVLLPAAVITEIEKLIRHFVWGASNGKKKLPLVSWVFVCQPIRSGGLGIRDLRVHHKAFMVKFDVWIPSLGPLVNHTVSDAIVEVDAYVCDSVDEHGNWKWADLNPVITQSAAMQIASVCPQMRKQATIFVFGGGNQIGSAQWR